MLLLSRGRRLGFSSEAGRPRTLIPVGYLVRVFALVLILQQSTQASDKTWKNSGTDFNTSANWNPSGVPGSGDRAVFNAAMSVQPNLSAALTIQELYFSGTSTSGYNLTSSSTSIKLTLTNTGTGTTSAIDAENTTGTNTIGAPIILCAAGGSTQTFTQASGGTLVIFFLISRTTTVTLTLPLRILSLT